MKPVRALLLVAALVLLAAVPWFGSDTLVQFGINTLLLAVLAQGWNIIGGYAGYASFGNSVFYGLGSYGVAIAMVHWHLPFAVGLAFGVALGIVFACSLGVAVLRLRGHYFAIATLALAQVMTAIVSNVGIAGQNVGLVLPPLNDDRGDPSPRRRLVRSLRRIRARRGLRAHAVRPSRPLGRRISTSGGRIGVTVKQRKNDGFNWRTRFYRQTCSKSELMC